MKYLMLIKHAEDYSKQVPPQSLMDAMGKFIGGYAIVEAKSKELAVELASQFMDLHRVHWPEFVGECEIRPFEPMG